MRSHRLALLNKRSALTTVEFISLSLHFLSLFFIFFAPSTEHFNKIQENCRCQMMMNLHQMMMNQTVQKKVQKSTIEFKICNMQCSLNIYNVKTPSVPYPFQKFENSNVVFTLEQYILWRTLHFENFKFYMKRITRWYIVNVSDVLRSLWYADMDGNLLSRW